MSSVSDDAALLGHQAQRLLIHVGRGGAQLAQLGGAIGAEGGGVDGAVEAFWPPSASSANALSSNVSWDGLALMSLIRALNSLAAASLLKDAT